MEDETKKKKRGLAKTVKHSSNLLAENGSWSEEDELQSDEFINHKERRRRRRNLKLGGERERERERGNGLTRFLYISLKKHKIEDSSFFFLN